MLQRVKQNDKKDRLCFVLDVLKNFESNSYKIADERLNELRSLLANSLHEFLRTNKRLNFVDKHIVSQVFRCKTFLRDNNNIFVTNADKGQVTVIMDKNSYIEQMTNTLNDPLTYKKLKKDPIKKITSKLNDLVKSWRNGGIINDIAYR